MESLFILVTAWFDPIIKPASFFLVFLLSCTMVSDDALVNSAEFNHFKLGWTDHCFFFGKYNKIQSDHMRTSTNTNIYTITQVSVWLDTCKLLFYE